LSSQTLQNLAVAAALHAAAPNTTTRIRGDTVTRPPLRGRPCTAADRTGGPLDQILDELHTQIPGLVVERLQQPHPGDDDNVYFLGIGSDLDRVQVDTAPGGQPPFLIEADQRLQTADPAHATATIHTWLTS
jgi:hypothetical protein